MPHPLGEYQVPFRVATPSRYELSGMLFKLYFSHNEITLSYYVKNDLDIQFGFELILLKGIDSQS